MGKLNGLIIGVDFDGTCVTHEYPSLGREIGAAPVLLEFVKEGAKLILWTMRSGPSCKEAEKWFSKHNIPLWSIGINPDQSIWTSSRKAYANLYIDDAALGAPLLKGLPGERPFIDWKKVREIVFDKYK